MDEPRDISSPGMQRFHQAVTVRACSGSAGNIPANLGWPGLPWALPADLDHVTAL